MSFVIAILMFSFIVIVHELGHFIAAKRNGIVVEEFAIGMGPQLVKKTFRGTVWSIRALPFGGFCKMLGEDEANEAEGSYNSKSIWARFKVIFAGPFFNILLAFIGGMIYISIVGAQTTEITTVFKDTAAEEAGIMAGDKIVGIGDHHIISYNEVMIYLQEYKNETIDITVRRDGEKVVLQATPRYLEDEGRYYLGITTSTINQGNVLELIKYSTIEIVYNVKLVYYSLGMIFSGSVSVDEVSGPVGIVNIVSDGYEASAQYGLRSIIATMTFFMTLLSANLAVMNLLPIPALDGGRLIFILIEGVRGKPLSPDKEGWVHFVGFVILMGLMVLVLFNDIRKLFV